MHLASSYVHPIGDGEGGKCLIRLFVPEKEGEEHERPVVICTELADNPGLSILHHTSRIAGWFMRAHREALSAEPVWIEHSPSSEGEEEQFYLTTFRSFETREARAPYMGRLRWRSAILLASLSTGKPSRRLWGRASRLLSLGLSSFGSK